MADTKTVNSVASIPRKSRTAICTNNDDAPFCCCCCCCCPGKPLGPGAPEEVKLACFDPWPPGTPPAGEVPLTLLVPADVTTESVAVDDVLGVLALCILEVGFELELEFAPGAGPLGGGGCAPFTRMPLMGVTVPSSPFAFWYAEPPSSSATLTIFQPLLWIKGNAVMNALTVSFVSSCSRGMRPGLLGPVIHFLRFACTDAGVAPPLSPMLQSSVLFRAEGKP